MNEKLKTKKYTKSLDARKWRIRYSLQATGLQKVEAGTVVTVTNIVERAQVVYCKRKIIVKKLAKTTNGQLVPISYLEPKETYHIKDSEIGALLVPAHIGKGSWWLGYKSPVEAAIELTKHSNLIQGTYCVCQPPEWKPTESNKWHEFCLVVRNYTGSVDDWIWEWREAILFNNKFQKFGTRDILNDCIPCSPPGPASSVVYLPIRRTKDGLFYLTQTNTFYSIDELLNFYEYALLPIHTVQNHKIILKLTVPLNVNSVPFSSPRPMLAPMKCPGYQNKSVSLLQSTSQNIHNFCPRFWKDHLAGGGYTKELVVRGYFYVNNSYAPIVLRKIKKDTFCSETFDLDMIKICSMSNIKKYTNMFGKERNILGYQADISPEGHQFLAHLVSYGKDYEFGIWLAYEAVIGLPLDRLLRKRRYDDLYVSPRAQYEILYQIASGMRFLENNHLCHRHLRASNVIVQNEQMDHFSIKITDYMVPYHFLHDKNVDYVNLLGLDWLWCAPESLLERKFDIVSDIWSFGCVVFEVMTMGMKPYAYEQPNIKTANQLVTFLTTGHKMKRMDRGEEENFVDDVIERCMSRKASARPPFAYLHEFFRALLFDFSNKLDNVTTKYIKLIPEKFEHKHERLGGRRHESSSGTHSSRTHQTSSDSSSD